MRGDDLRLALAAEDGDISADVIVGVTFGDGRAFEKLLRKRAASTAPSRGCCISPSSIRPVSRCRRTRSTTAPTGLSSSSRATGLTPSWRRRRLRRKHFRPGRSDVHPTLGHSEPISWGRDICRVQSLLSASTCTSQAQPEQTRATLLECERLKLSSTAVPRSRPGATKCRTAHILAQPGSPGFMPSQGAMRKELFDWLCHQSVLVPRPEVGAAVPLVRFSSPRESTEILADRPMLQ